MAYCSSVSGTTDFSFTIGGCRWLEIMRYWIKVEFICMNTFRFAFMLRLIFGLMCRARGFYTPVESKFLDSLSHHDTLSHPVVGTLFARRLGPLSPFGDPLSDLRSRVGSMFFQQGGDLCLCRSRCYWNSR